MVFKVWHLRPRTKMILGKADPFISPETRFGFPKRTPRIASFPLAAGSSEEACDPSSDSSGRETVEPFVMSLCCADMMATKVGAEHKPIIVQQLVEEFHPV